MHEKGDVTVCVLPCGDDTKSSDSLNCIYIPTRKMTLIVPIIYFSHDSTALVGLGLFCEVSRQHSDLPYSVGILWTSDRAVTETSVWRNISLTRDRHQWPPRDSNPQSQQAFDITATGLFPQTCARCQIVIVMKSGSRWLNGQVGIMTKIWNE